jgi:tetratricopeptide (TPR) repeat protein
VATLSATLIVRDEADVLADCLRSLRGLVDETVVVDTGSTDASVRIAAEFGARVLHYRWRDDFSAARNHAIEHATGDWLLYIDADERARPIDRAALADELNADLLCATVRFRPRTGYTAYREYRLIRRDPRIRFHGAMHETFLPDVNRLVDAGAGHIGASSLALDHIGYDGDQSHKYDRNLRLLQKQLQADPSRAYLHWHLGTLHRDAGRPLEAEQAWQTGLAQEIDGPGAGLCALELVRLRAARGEDPGSLADALRPDDPMLRWLRGKALLAAGAYDEAVPIFTALAAIDPETVVAGIAYDARLFGAHAWAELGDAAARLGRFADSRGFYANAEAMAPASLEFRVKRQFAAARA